MKPNQHLFASSTVGLFILVLLASCGQSGGGGQSDPTPPEPEPTAINGEVYSYETGMIDGATLLVSALDKDGSHWSYLPEPYRNLLPKSDANGQFAAAAGMALPAEITVLAERAGYVQPCRASARADGKSIVRVEMLPLSAFDVTTSPRPQSSIEPSLTGVIIEMTEQGPMPVAGATIRVEESLPAGAELAYFQNHNEQPAAIRVATTRTDLSGGFHVCNLGPPVYLRVSKVGYAERLIGPIDASTAEALEIELAHPLPPGGSEQLAFVRDGQIYRVNADGSGLVQLTEGPNDGEPAWSPDGSRIAFTRRNGDQTDIFIVNADGSNLVQRTSCSYVFAFNGRPSWSPDGAWIAYGQYCGSDSGGIYRMKADDDGTDPIPIVVRAGVNMEPAWSPDGTRIAFLSDWVAFDFAVDIYVSDLAGSAITQLTNGLFYGGPNGTRIEYYHPTWSPDGLKLAFLSCLYTAVGCAPATISAMNADGTDVVRLADVTSSGWPSFSDRLSWSPDGQYVAYGRSGSIYWVTADGGASDVLIDNGHSPAWRP